MHNEDDTAAKLKGYNVLIKFIDGEILYLMIENIDSGWFSEADEFINGDVTYFPGANITVRRDQIKYIRSL